MKGSYRIQVSTKKVKYDFTVHRNITVIQGDSGTGKTTLISLIQRFNRSEVSGVTLKCDKKCRVVTNDNDDWAEKLLRMKDSILFIHHFTSF